MVRFVARSIYGQQRKVTCVSLRYPGDFPNKQIDIRFLFIASFFIMTGQVLGEMNRRRSGERKESVKRGASVAPRGGQVFV